MQERDAAIIRLLRVKQYMTVPMLCDALDVSPATIRRALTRLDAEGRLQYINGGALLLKPDVGLNPEMTPAKQLIAQAALSFIQPRDTLFLDAGSTNDQLADALVAIDDITVITNSIYIANKLCFGNPNITVYVCGGSIRSEGPLAATVGSLAESLIERMRAQTFFMGAAAVDAIQGITDPFIHAASIKRCMMQNAQRTILLCDHTKFGCVQSAFVTSLDQVDILITDTQETPSAECAEMNKLGKQVVMV